MLVNIFMLLLFWPFSYSLMQFPPSILKLSTQHPPYFFKLSTQHQPAITRIENWTKLPTQGLQFSYTLIRTFSKISAYTKTVQFYSTKNTSMNKFLAQSSSPWLMLGGIPPASLSEGCQWPVHSEYSVTWLLTSWRCKGFTWCWHLVLLVFSHLISRRIMLCIHIFDHENPDWLPWYSRLNSDIEFRT